MLYHELPDNVRMRLWEVIEEAGGEVAGYQEETVQVAMPRDVNAFCTALEDAGLSLVHGSEYLFPLGTDNPPDQLRHDGNYPRSRGFWRYARFVPTNPEMEV